MDCRRSKKGLKSSLLAAILLAAFFFPVFPLQAEGVRHYLLSEVSPKTALEIPEDLLPALRSRPVSLAPIFADPEGPAVGDELVLNLFEDAVYPSRIDRVATDINGVTAVRARLKDSPYGYAIISTLEDVSVAVIRLPSGNRKFRFESVPGKQAGYLLEIDLDKLPTLRCGVCADDPAETRAEKVPKNQSGTEIQVLAGEWDEAEVDVMVLYTPALEELVGRLLPVRVNNRMEHAQMTLENSNTLVNLRLVYLGLLDYEEVWDIGADFSNLQDLDEVDELRDAHGADLVSFWLDYSHEAYSIISGRGNIGGAFSIITTQRLDIFIHELGHNFGCGHSKTQSDSPGPGLEDYAAGWYFQGDPCGTKFRTIMAYKHDGHNERAPVFSSPLIAYQGGVVGCEVDGDNARLIREKKHIVAAWRDNTYQQGPPGLICLPISPDDGIPLSQALHNHNQGLLWRTGGDARWRGQKQVGYCGSAQSGCINHNQETWLETTVIGPGTLSFSWAVCSETDRDRLLFLEDGAVKDSISGVSANPGSPVFSRRNFSIGPGRRKLRWVYRKDGSGTSGCNSAWLNGVYWDPEFTLGMATDNSNLYWKTRGTAPWSYQTDAGAIGGASARSGVLIIPGQYSILETTVEGPGTLGFWWRMYSETESPPAGSFLVDVTGPGNSKTILQASGNHDWTWKQVKIGHGSHTLKWVYLSQEPLAPGMAWVDGVKWAHDVSLCRALDNCALAWETGGDAPWFGQELISYDGIDAAQGGKIDPGWLRPGDFRSSWLETTVRGPGRLSFWVNFSAGQGNLFSETFRFFINDVEQFNHWHTDGWLQYEYDLDKMNLDGTYRDYTLRWRFAYQPTCPFLAYSPPTAWLDRVTWARDYNIPPGPQAVRPRPGELTTRRPSLRASAYRPPPSGCRQGNSRWQVSESPSPDQLVWDSGEWYPAGDSTVVPEGELTAGKSYYWRSRYGTDLGIWSDWSEWTGPFDTGIWISGEILDSSGEPIPGVALEGLPGKPSTSHKGYYSGLVGPDSSGYTRVQPRRKGYDFFPPARYYYFSNGQLRQLSRWPLPPVSGHDYIGRPLVFRDFAVYRPVAGLWSVRGHTRIYFGSRDDLPAPEDYSGDGIIDIAVFRQSSGLWAARGVTRVYFGGAGDIPVARDYDGSGTADIAVFRESSGLWAARGVTRAFFGTSGDIPLPGDYAGDGTARIGIFRPASGLWAIRGLTRFYFGGRDDRPAPADYAGSGAWIPAIYRPASGLWAIRGLTRAHFGGRDDTPVPGDYDGTGTARIGIYRPASGLWAIRGLTRAYFGTANDFPLK